MNYDILVRLVRNSLPRPLIFLHLMTEMGTLSETLCVSNIPQKVDIVQYNIHARLFLCSSVLPVAISALFQTYLVNIILKNLKYFLINANFQQDAKK
jgi:hypothetical protein